MAEKIEKIEIETPILPETKPEVSTSSNNIPLPQKTNTKLYVIIGILIGLLICSGVAFGAYYFLNQNKNKIEVSKESQPSSTTTQTQPANITEARWLNPPISVSINVFKKTDKSQELSEGGYFETDKAKFFKVAEFEDGSSLINTNLPYNGMMVLTNLVRFIETKDKKYSCLSDNLTEWQQDEIGKILIQEISFVSKEIQGLVAPEVIESGKNKYLKIGANDNFLETLKNPLKIEETSFGTIYSMLTEVETDLDIKSRVLYLVLKDNTIISYKLKVPFYTDDGVPEIFFKANNNQKNSSSFTQRGFGSCGGIFGGVPVIKNGSSLITDKTEVGKTVDGDLIYQVMGSQSKLVKWIYDNYKNTRGTDTYIETIEQMAAKPNHFLWQDNLSDWQIYINKDYEMLAECAKPVIYLYPTQKTEVSVKIGAKIRLSEPLYPENGWQVTAYPDGKLIYNGQPYDSLFWEGLGKGVYPDTQNYGFVVAQKDLLATLKNHLLLLGLNEKEAADFQDFWVEKLPKTPYVRLTWLGTRDMDLLAPLEVTPKPDTQIRIFLEFEGLEKPIALKPQRLSAPKRNGFTLVEWGGLIHGQNLY